MVACDHTSRACRGIDIDPTYVDVAVRRWQRLSRRRGACSRPTARTFEEVAAERAGRARVTRPTLQAAPEAARETGSAEFGSFFHIVDSSEGDRCAYPARLDTYGCGCAHDCSYCYAKSLLDFRGLWNPRAPLAADMAKIRALIPSLRGTVRLGGMTDCFQPAERRVRNT